MDTKQIEDTGVEYIATTEKSDEENLLLFRQFNTDTDKFVGFNLRNLSQLRFKDYKQLVDGLVERLEKHYGVK